MNDSLLAFALLYALAFWAVCWTRPQWALASIFAVAPFSQDLGGGPLNMSLAEINLLLTIPIFLVNAKRFSLGPLTWGVAIFLGSALLTSLLNWRGGSTLTSLLQTALYVGAVVLIFSAMARRPQDFLPALRALLVIACVFALAVVAFRTNYVLGVHKNATGATLAAASIVATELFFWTRSRAEKWAYAGALGIICLGLVLTLSRGAWLSAMTGILLITVLRRQYLLMGRAAILLLPILFFGWQMLPQSDREYATSADESRWNIAQRYRNIDFAREHWESSPIFGVGIGLRKEMDATNLMWVTLAESGVVGLAAFVVYIGSILWMLWITQKRLPRDDLTFSLLAIGGAMILGRLVHGMFDHFWTRGATVMAFSATGMALYAHFAGASVQTRERAQRIVAALTLIHHRGRELEARVTPAAATPPPTSTAHKIG